MDTADVRMSCWRAAQRVGASSDHCASADGSFRNMPSPEHGASTKMASNASGHAAPSSAGDALVTAAAVPIRSRFSARMRTLAGWISLATSCPSSFAVARWLWFCRRGLRRDRECVRQAVGPKLVQWPWRTALEYRTRRPRGILSGRVQIPGRYRTQKASTGWARLSGAVPQEELGWTFAMFRI